VSHAPERHEKNCLNCGATVVGRYCHVCGQENIVPRESFGGLVLHFFYDITHFDGKFFQSLKYLLINPGFLPKEYIKGRRSSHLNPVRMYVFTSAIFFLVFFLLVNIKGRFDVVSNERPLTNAQRVKMIGDLESELNKKEADTSALSQKLKRLKDTTTVLSNSELLKISFWRTDSNTRSYHSLAEYDSVQHSLPSDQQDGWFNRMMIRKQIELTNKFEGSFQALVLEWIEIFLHRLPYLLFISLPIFALILKLLYIRRRQFYYVDHAIFSIHHYIFSFIILLAIFLLGAAKQNYGVHWLRVAQVILIIVWPIYLYIAMLNFYKQGWFKTFIKFSLLNLLGSLSLLILFVVFIALTIFQT
jgi:hypothetical protein